MNVKNVTCQNLLSTGSMGDIFGSLLTEKVFITETSTGSISVPHTAAGGKCEIKTTTGDIGIKISESTDE